MSKGKKKESHSIFEHCVNCEVSQLGRVQLCPCVVKSRSNSLKNEKCHFNIWFCAFVFSPGFPAEYWHKLFLSVKLSTSELFTGKSETLFPKYMLRIFRTTVTSKSEQACKIIKDLALRVQCMGIRNKIKREIRHILKYYLYL